MAWVLEYQPTILFPGKGYIPYEPWPFQQAILQDRSQYRAVNKPRQCGVSTTEAVEAAWEFDNIAGSVIVIISKDKDAAVNFHKYIYNILHSVRDRNKKAPKLLKTNERETTNDIGSRIVSLPASKETGRSFSATHMFFDEMAHAEYADDIFQAASPTLAQTNGRITAISTPKGRANLFYRIFENPKKMNFNIHQLSWWDVPTYNPYYKEYMASKNKNERKRWIEKAREGKWYRMQRPKYSELQWMQEFEGSFDANAGTVFSTRAIEKVFCKNYLTEREDLNGVITEWYTSQRKENAYYVTGIDLGRKRDATVICTYDCSSERPRMVDFKYIDGGFADWQQIEDVVREHLEFWEGDAYHDATGVGGGISDKLEGLSEPFHFTKQSKQNMIEAMQHCFDWGACKIPKIDVLYREHQKYIWDDKNITQDTVMANGIAVQGFHDMQDTFIGVDTGVNYVQGG